MNNNQTAAGTMFLWSWALMFLAHLLPDGLANLAIAIAVLTATAAFIVALLIAFDEAQHHLDD